MKKQLLKFSALLSLVSVFCSCSDSDKPVGCWQQGSIVFSLGKDGTLITNSSHGNGTWKLIENDRLNFAYSNGSEETHTIVKTGDGVMIVKHNGLAEHTWTKTECKDLSKTASDGLGTEKEQPAEIKKDTPTEKFVEMLKGSDNFILPLPADVKTVKSSIGNYSQFVPADPEDPSPWGGEYVWNFTNGLTLTALSPTMEQSPKDEDEVTIYSLESKNGQQIYVPSYSLTLNKSSIAECRQLYGGALKTISPNYFKINKNGIRSYFTFTENGRLQQITQAKADIEGFD